MDFILTAISDHKQSDLYRTALDADMYYRHLNPTIMAAQKLIYDALGQAHIDVWTANHKIPCRYFFYFLTQAVQFLLGNGVSFAESDETKEKFSKGFDDAVQKAATRAMVCGVAFGLLSQNEQKNEGDALTYKVTVFDPLEFVPLVDEEDGSLKAGVRFWQIDGGKNKKPLRATLYELDGYTDYVKPADGDMDVLNGKLPYIVIRQTSEASGVEIVDGMNYPGFPIVPLWNINKQSEIVGNRETLDAYDLMASALVNNVDDANLIYWVIRNAGGMDAVDANKFIRQLHTTRVAMVEGEEEVDAHTIDVPFQASETALARLRSQLFDDFMALDVKDIASGAVTATQIEAAYEPLNSKTDMFEHQVSAFIRGLLALLGIDDEPLYTRSMIINQSEMIQNLLSAATVLPGSYITRKILEILGDTDKADEVLDMLAAEDMSRFDSGADDTDEGETTEG